MLEQYRVFALIKILDMPQIEQRQNITILSGDFNGGELVVRRNQRADPVQIVVLELDKPPSSVADHEEGEGDYSQRDVN